MLTGWLCVEDSSRRIWERGAEEESSRRRAPRRIWERGAKEDERGLCVEEDLGWGVEESSRRRASRRICLGGSRSGAPRRIRRGGGRRFVEEEAGALRGGSVWGIWVAEDSSRGRRGGFVEEEAAALRGGGFVEGAPRRICRGGGRHFPFFCRRESRAGFLIARDRTKTRWTNVAQNGCPSFTVVGD